MQSRSEFSDENSVIYRLGERPEPPAPEPPPRVSPQRLTRAAPRPHSDETRPVRRPPVAPDRVTTPHATPLGNLATQSTQSIDVTRAASTLVTRPDFADQAASPIGGTIELTPEMLEPVEGTIE